MNWIFLAQISQETQLGITTAVITTMGAVVSFLFAYVMKFVADTKVDLKECKDDRDALHDKMHALALEVGKYRREQS
jgi:hypothetical protein